jgi:hypothetical protein
LVTGLVAIPVKEEADARSNTDPERNKGKEAGDTNYGKYIPVLAVMRR